MQCGIRKDEGNSTQSRPLRIVILGLSITSSWGNGHATTYRGLMRALVNRGHHVLFLERDVPWYAENRDLPRPPYGKTVLYASLGDLKRRFAEEVRTADFVMVGSYVPEGAAVGEWVTSTTRGTAAFYDIDTPVTLAKLERGDTEYLSADLIPRYALYLSFTGGPLLDRIEREYGSSMARPLYCSVDTSSYFPVPCERKWGLGYLGTYSDDRQPLLERLLLDPARSLKKERFAVAGSLYPDTIGWPPNVEKIGHLSPAHHGSFYNSMRFTLNITRADMVRAGYSPSVRLFEAAACATPVISDYWEGLDIFFTPGVEILLSSSAADTTRYLQEMGEEELRAVGERARARVLAGHTAAHRAWELESLINGTRAKP